MTDQVQDVLYTTTNDNPLSLRWLRRNAQRNEQSCQNGEGLLIQVYGDRNLFAQKLSPNQPDYIDVAQERSQVF